MDNKRYQSQRFSFDMTENPEVDLRDYFYGIPNCPSIANPPHYRARGESLQVRSDTGSMRRAQKLYVKWRIKATGQEYEDNVDLRERLPNDMTGQVVTFLIRDSQLYVYLVTHELRSPDMPPNGPRKFKDYKTLTIYPNEK